MTQKIAICTPSHNFVGLNLRNQGTYRQSGKKLVKQQYLLHVSLNMANFVPLAVAIGSGVWGIPSNFNGFRVLASLLQRRCSPEANQTLHDVLPSPGLVCYIYTFSRFLPPDRILPCAKFTLHPSLAFCNIGSVTARHSQRGQPNCGVVLGMELRNFCRGHHL